MTSQSSQATGPARRTGPNQATARKRETVGHRAEIAVAELAGRVVAAEPADDRTRRVPAGLHRDLSDARQVVEAHQVADDKHLRMARQCAIGKHRHAA